MQEISNMMQEETALSQAERAKAADISEKINLSDSGAVLQYGAALQKKIAEFSDSALANVRTKDLGETGDMISDLVAELKGFSANEKEEGGFFGLFKKSGNPIARMKTRYDRAENNVDKIVEELEKHQNQLLKDIVMLDKMYEMNLEYFRDLSMYILAGKERLKREREVTLLDLREKAEKSGLAEDAQSANDLEALCQRFEKKLYDLNLTRTICMQMVRVRFRSYSFFSKRWQRASKSLADWASSASPDFSAFSRRSKRVTSRSLFSLSFPARIYILRSRKYSRFISYILSSMTISFSNWF